MRPKKPLMGLCPVGKFVFSNEDAIRQKKLLQAALAEWDVEFVDLEGVLEDGLIKDQAHVVPAVRHFKVADVDCLFIPHCNFGTEGAAAMTAKRLGVPTLLWGPRDEAPLPDGSRLRDSLCGLFATSKVMRKLGVTFTYIENCHIDDPLLRQGVDVFLRAVNVAKVFRKGCRIGQLGQRIDFFWSTIINESDLLTKFNVELLPLDMVSFIRYAQDRAEKGRAGYQKEIDTLRQEAEIEGLDDAALMNVLAVRDQILALGENHDLDGFAIQDFMSLIDAMGAYCFFADSAVADKYAVGYESDVHGALSDLLLRRASFDCDPAFLTDFTIRHPENDNAVLLWHSGAALALRHPSEKIRLGQHWILPSALSGMTHFRLKDGPITIARFDGESNDYQLAVGKGKTIDGPTTLNNYAWFEVDDWPRWERQLITGPFMHHVAIAYGHYESVLREAARYIPNLKLVRLGRCGMHEMPLTHG